MKGISPVIAIVLLIAFTVSVAGILSIWLMGFATTSTGLIEEEATRELICSYGGISLSDLKFCSTNDRLAGKSENTGTINIGNITIQIIYTNGTTQKSETGAELLPREIYQFNISTNSNYDKIRVITNCSSVYDQVSSSDVTSGC